MATVEVTPVLQELPITADKRTYSRIAIDSGEKDKDGNAVIEYKVVSEDDAKELVKEHKEGTTITIEVTQTFDFDHGNTLAGLQELFSVSDENGNKVFNEKELCKQTNNAVDTKLGNKVRKLMLATDENGDWSFEPVEGSQSLRSYIGEDTASRGKTQFEKAKSILGKLPPDQLAQLMAMLQAGQQ